MKDIEKFLKKVPVEELRSFVTLHSHRNADFKADLEIYFSGKNEKADLAEKYAERIHKIVRRYERKGFIDYSDSFKLSGDFNDLLQSADLLLEKQNFLDTFTLSRVALKESIQLITYCDDSAGCIGGVIHSCIDLLAGVAEHPDAGMPLKHALFSWLQAELQQPVYFDYGDFGYQMFEIFESLALKTGQADAFLAHVDRELAKPDDRYSDYNKNFYTIRKIAFLTANGRTDEAEAITAAHLDVVELRQLMVNRAIAAQDLVQAKSLVNGGIVIAQKKDHPGTVSIWKKELLRIAVLEADVPTIRHYTRHFAFDRGFDQTYYRDWRATYPADEWSIVLEQCIHEQIGSVMEIYEKNKKRGWISAGKSMLSLQSTVARIYIEEGFLDRLMKLVMKEESLALILYYHDELVEHYPAELLSLYLPAIRRSAENTSDRRQYRDLVKDMKRIINDIPEGKLQLLELAGELKRVYYRRPAMVEELENLLTK